MTNFALEFQDFTIRFETPEKGVQTVIDSISVAIEEGTFVSIVGPSGCGKSTLLNASAGLLFSPKGRVLSFGEPVNGINPHATYLFQQDVVLPWRTVLDNVSLGLFIRQVPRKEAVERSREWLAKVGLHGVEDLFPFQLSGGMRKRVAIAQTWIVDPRILLMDEPFSALDVHTRQAMETELLGLWQESRKTVLFVTHDLEEAIALSDRVIVMSANPARIKGDYAVNLKRPRDVAEIRFDPNFDELYKRIWSDMRAEVRVG